MQKTLKQLTCAAFAVGALASCNEYVDYTEGSITSSDAKFEEKVAEFDEAFIERFGEPDPEHTWGTDKVLAPMFPPVTRADGTAGTVEVNRNQWCEIDKSTGSGKDLKVEYKDFALINKVQVPGWPNDDGLFYTSGGAGALQNIYNLTEVAANKPQPVGDVTDYEIQYVSTWFRTHKDIQKMPLHLTDFFVQTISCDNDQLWYDGAVSGYTNDLGGLGQTPGYNGPNAIHAADVLGPTGNTPRTDYGKTLVPKVTRIGGSDNSNEELNYRMDYLHFGDMTSGTKPSGFDNVDGAWTHINNFNRGNSNYNPEENEELAFREIKYVHSSGTENFACRPSMGIERNWITDWVLVHLEWDEVMADGQTHKRSGYYLGFDFQTTSGNTQIECDGFYSNWIIKITPAYLNPGEHSARVMCEDLGGSFDFDYNDVVFDIAYDNNTDENIICLQAAGGTLPLFVGRKDNEKFEAHYLLGQSALVPTNVITNGTKHEVAIYRIPAVYINGERNDYRMPIYVEQDGSMIDVNTNIPQKSDYEWKVDNVTNGTGHYEQSKDKTPRKFVTRVGVKWPIELAGIDVAYKRFYDWVKNGEFKYENLNGNGDLEWYNAPGDDRLIYDYNNNQTISIDGTHTNDIKQWMEMHVVGIKTNFTNQELATEIFTIADYVGQNSIIDQMNGKGVNKQQITFAYIMKSKNDEVVPAGVMIPVWIKDNKPYYISSTGVENEITETMVSNADIYTNAVLQPNFCQNKYVEEGQSQSGNATTGIDPLGFKTYINKFTFAAHDLYYEKDGAKVWCDYVMFFCKQKYDDSTSTNYNGGSTAVYTNPAKHNGDVHWYETYAIL